MEADTVAVASTNTSVHSTSLAWGGYPANDDGWMDGHMGCWNKAEMGSFLV